MTNISKSVKINLVNPISSGVPTNWIHAYQHCRECSDLELAEDLERYLPNFNKEVFLKMLENNRKQLKKIKDYQLIHCLTPADRHQVNINFENAELLYDPEVNQGTIEDLLEDSSLDQIKVPASIYMMHSAICKWLDRRDTITYGKKVDVKALLKDYLNGGNKIYESDEITINLNYGHNRQAIKDKLLVFLYMMFENLSNSSLGSYVFCESEKLNKLGKVCHEVPSGKETLIAICRQFGLFSNFTQNYVVPFNWSDYYNGEVNKVQGSCTRYYINRKVYNRYKSDKFTFISINDNKYINLLSAERSVKDDLYTYKERFEYQRVEETYDYYVIKYTNPRTGYVDYSGPTGDPWKYFDLKSPDFRQDYLLRKGQGHIVEVEQRTGVRAKDVPVKVVDKILNQKEVDRIFNQLTNIYKSYCSYDDYVAAKQYISDYESGIENDVLKEKFGNIYQARTVVAINEKDQNAIFKYALASKSRRLYHRVNCLKKDIRHNMFDAYGYPLIEIDLSSSIATLLPYVLSPDFTHEESLIRTSGNLSGRLDIIKLNKTERDLSKFNFSLTDEAISHFSYPRDIDQYYESIYFEPFDSYPTSQLSADAGTGEFYKKLAVKAKLIKEDEELTKEMKADIKLAFMKLVNGHKAYKIISSLDTSKTLINKVWYAVCTYDKGYLAKSINYCKRNGIDLANMILLAETDFISRITNMSREFVMTIHDSIKLPINRIFDFMHNTFLNFTGIEGRDNGFTYCSNDMERTKFLRVNAAWKLEYNLDNLGIAI